MNINKIINILRFELSVALMSKSFIRSVAILPLVLCITTLSLVGVHRFVVPKDSGVPLALVDRSGMFSFSGGPCEKSKLGQPTNLQSHQIKLNEKKKESDGEQEVVTSTVICFESLEEAQQQLINRKVSGLIAMPQDFSETARIQIFNRDSDSLDMTPSMFAFENCLRQKVIDTFGISDQMKKLILGGSEYEKYALNKDGKFISEEEGILKDRTADKHSHGALKIWGILIVLMSSSIGYGCTMEERRTKLIEVILSSVTSAEYLLGKVIASTAVTISLISCWFGMGYVVFQALGRDKKGLDEVSSVASTITPEVLWMIAFTIIGAICANIVGAAFGVLSKPNGEKSSTALPFALLQQGGFLLPVLVQARPSSTLAIVTSFIPPISAPVMLARLGSGELSQAQIVGPLAVLIVSTFLVMLVAIRLMRLCLQLEGQRFNPIRIIRAICS
jgi:ABC-type Na+ efflux pump permease subunit